MSAPRAGAATTTTYSAYSASASASARRRKSSSRERNDSSFERARDVAPSATPRDSGGGQRRTHHSPHHNHHPHPSLRPVKLSALLRDVPSCFDPLKLRISVVDRRLSIIDDIPAAYHPTQRLYMSHNCVSSLSSLARQFRQLRLLSAGDNPVDDLPQLDALAKGCPHLEALSLELTPLSRLPFYRAHVLARMPNLRSLDGTPVRPGEVEAAPGLVRRDVGLLEMLMTAAITAAKLRRAYQLSRVHEELLAVVYAAHGPVSPSSLPARGESPEPLDARRFLRLCSPERSMTASEVAELARRLRRATATEAKAERARRKAWPSVYSPDIHAVFKRLNSYIV